MRILQLTFIAIIFYLVQIFPAFAFDIEVSEKPLADVLKIFSKELDLNFVAASDALELKITASIKNADASDALELILKTNLLGFNQETSNTFSIFKLSDSDKYLSASTYVFKVSNSDAAVIASMLKIAYPGIEFVADKSKGTIFAAGHFSDKQVFNIKEKIKSLDLKIPRVHLSFELFKISNRYIAETLASFSGAAVKNPALKFDFSGVLNRGKSVTRGNIMLMPGSRNASIERASSVAYSLCDADGRVVGTAESVAGDILNARVISADGEKALIDFSLESSYFGGGSAYGAPPSKTGDRISSVIELKNGEKAFIGGIDSGGLTKVWSDNSPECNMVRKLRVDGRSVGSSVNSGDEGFYIYAEVKID